MYAGEIPGHPGSCPSRFELECGGLCASVRLCPVTCHRTGEHYGLEIETNWGVMMHTSFITVSLLVSNCSPLFCNCGHPLGIVLIDDSMTLKYLALISYMVENVSNSFFIICLLINIKYIQVGIISPLGNIFRVFLCHYFQSCYLAGLISFICHVFIFSLM